MKAIKDNEDKDTSLRYNNETRRSVQESEGSSLQPVGELHPNPSIDFGRSVRQDTGVPYKLFEQHYGPTWKDLVKDLEDTCRNPVTANVEQPDGKAVICILYLKNDEESVFTFLEKFEVIHVYTDACLKSIGAYWKNKSVLYVFHGKLDLPKRDVVIHDVEMLAVFVAIRVWRRKWRSKIVCVHTDNDAVVFAFNHIQNCEKVRAERLRQMLEMIKEEIDSNEISLRCEFIKGNENKKADHQSRHDVNSFKKRFGYTSCEESEVKDIVKSLLSKFLNKFKKVTQSSQSFVSSESSKGLFKTTNFVLAQPT